MFYVCLYNAKVPETLHYITLETIYSGLSKSNLRTTIAT